jgi:hypothetical protein
MRSDVPRSTSLLTLRAVLRTANGQPTRSEATNGRAAQSPRALGTFRYRLATSRDGAAAGTGLRRSDSIRHHRARARVVPTRDRRTEERLVETIIGIVLIVIAAIEIAGITAVVSANLRVGR